MKTATLEIFNVLDKMFNLPPNIVELHLHLTMDTAPCLEIEFIPDYTKPEV
jgi:hypothetical protein